MLTSGTTLVERGKIALLWEIASAADFRTWVPQWDSLNQSTWDSPLLAASMLVPALEHLSTNTQKVATARRGSRIVAMAIVHPRSSFVWEVFQPSQLPLAAFIVSPDEHFGHVAHTLLNTLPPWVLAFSATHLDVKMLPEPTDTHRCEVRSHMTTGAIEFPDDATEYFASRSASLRQNVNRRTRRAAEDIGQPRLDVLTDEASVDPYMALYAETESRGWKGHASTAVRFDNVQGTFYRELLRRAARVGYARMFVLRFGEVPVAQQIAIAYRGALYLLKTTYDERFKAYAPGVLQRMHVVRWASTQHPRINRLELYGKLSEWQRPFVTSKRKIYHATFFRFQSIKQVKQFLKPADRNAGVSDAASGAETSWRQSSPFVTEAWFDMLDRTCRSSGDRVAILIPGQDGHGGGFRLWRVRGWSGAMLTGVSNFYTPLYAPLGTASQQDDAVRAIIRHLKGSRSWSALYLQPLAGDAPWLATLLDALKEAGLLHDTYHCFGNWYTNVEGLTIEEYDSALPSQLRTTLSRAEQRLRRHGQYELQIVSGSVEPQLLRTCIAEYLLVYGKSWKRSEPYPDFIPELFELASAQGWLRAGYLRLDGRPIATQLWLTHAKIASIFKLAYESSQSRFSPGSLLTMAMIRHAISVDHVREIDFLIGDDPYKNAWMRERRARVGLVVFNRSHPAGFAMAIAHFSGKAGKRALRLLAQKATSRAAVGNVQNPPS